MRGSADPEKAHEPASALGALAVKREEDQIRKDPSPVIRILHVISRSKEVWRKVRIKQLIAR